VQPPAGHYGAENSRSPVDNSPPGTPNGMAKGLRVHVLRVYPQTQKLMHKTQALVF